MNEIHWWGHGYKQRPHRPPVRSQRISSHWSHRKTKSLLIIGIGRLGQPFVGVAHKSVLSLGKAERLSCLPWEAESPTLGGPSEMQLSPYSKKTEGQCDLMGTPMKSIHLLYCAGKAHH